MIAACAHSAGAKATFDSIKGSYQPSDTLLLDRHGELLHRLRTALVLSEDKRFYEHSGVDWRAASTITMQLAGLLDEDLKRGSGGRSVVQKIGQTVSALLLERTWRKDQILEAYLNLVPFRGELVGIDALSQTLFSKAAHGLDHREAAVAAALVRAPNAKVPQVVQRACRSKRLATSTATAWRWAAPKCRC